MYVIPNSGRLVADPDKGGYLPKIGRKVETNTYWMRRLQDGDIKEVTATEMAELHAADEKQQIEAEALRRKQVDEEAALQLKESTAVQSPGSADKKASK